MLNMNDQHKNKHEEATCRRFLSIYNKENNSDLNFIKSGSPERKEPDCICSNNIAIELVGTYANEYQAKTIWTSVRGKDFSKQPDFLLLTFDNLQNEVGKKLQKLAAGNYNGFSGKIILVCNLHDPLLLDREAEQYIETYTPFRSDGYFDRYFDKIYISWKSEVDGNWKIKKLE